MSNEEPIVILVVAKAGQNCWKLPLKATEEPTASLAAAKEPFVSYFHIKTRKKEQHWRVFWWQRCFCCSRLALVVYNSSALTMGRDACLESPQAQIRSLKLLLPSSKKKIWSVYFECDRHRVCLITFEVVSKRASPFQKCSMGNTVQYSLWNILSKYQIIYGKTSFFWITLPSMILKTSQ